MNRDFLCELAATANVFLFRKFDAEEAEPAAALFPLLGIIAGFLFTLAAWTATVLFGHLTAALLAAILFPLLYEIATNWSGLRNLTSFLAMRAGNLPIALALTKQAEPERKLTPVFVFVSLYLLRMTAFGMIAFHRPAVFLYVFPGAYFIRAELTGYGADGEIPLLEIPEEKRLLPAALTGAAFAVTALLSFHLATIAAGILTAFAAFLILRVQQRSIRLHTGRATLRQIHIYGAAAELLLLYTGTIVL